MGRLLGLTSGLVITASFATAELRAETAPAFDPGRFQDALMSYGSKDRSKPTQPLKNVLPTPTIGPHFYAGAEYLIWWVKAAPLSVPLVSTGPIATTHHGLLGPPAENPSDSTILYGAPYGEAKGGNDTQSFNAFSGTRFTLGYEFDNRFAVEASGFLLQAQTATYAVRGDSSGNPVLGIPVHNSVTYNVGQQSIFPGEDSLPFSLPNDPARARANGIINGGIDITNRLQLWGFGADGVLNLYRGSGWEVSGLVGFRYLDLAEKFSLVVDIEGITGQYTGQSGIATDVFQTRNQFYGATLGLRGRYKWDRLSLDLAGSVALGMSHETIDVSGGFTDVNFGPVNSGSEGVFAQPSNEGHNAGNHFAYVPEGKVKVGYDLTPWLTLTVGYDILYYSNVVRPTDQIDRNIPKGQTFQQASPTISSTSPAKYFNTTDFYAQGLSVGLNARF
jgi:hypothetical protein